MFSQSSVARRGRSLHLNAQQLALPGLVSTTFSACIVVELRVGVIYCKVTKRRRVAMSSFDELPEMAIWLRPSHNYGISRYLSGVCPER